MSYNSARLHRSKVLHAYPPLLPYILDGHQIMGRTVRLYLQLSYPGVVSPSDHNLYFEGGKEPKVWEPTLNRVGLVWLTLEGKNKLLRIIHLQSYTFYLAFTEPGSGASAAKEFSAAFTRHSPGTVELLASRPKITLSCTGLDAWRAFKDSRQNSLV
jgi:hypothetical protein